MSDAEDEALADGVMTALRRVIDPELGYNIVDLGLVYRVDIEDAAVRVVMTTTTRGCPATEYLRGGAGAAVGSAPGVVSSAVELTYEPAWTPEMMSPQAKAHLGIDG
jgi:metal-sulfur cluster biosynthetic enzyme